METAEQAPGLEGLDVVFIMLYFIVVMAICIYAMTKTNRATVSGYFLAGRLMTWLPVGASVFASNIGSEHLIGLAGSGAAAGFGVGSFEINAMIMIDAWLAVRSSVHRSRGRVCTLPEYIHRRFGGQRIRVWLSVLSLLLYIFTKISVNLYSGALFINLALGWNLYAAIILLLGLACLCTITGGLAAVIYTDTLCTFLMTLGSLTVMSLGFAEVGGYEGLKSKYMVAVSNHTLHSNTSCGWPRQDSFKLLRDPVYSDIPWPGFIIGETIVSIWYWCADQVIVQRTLSSKSLSHAQGACLFAGWIKVLPLFTMLIPGMISRVLSPERVACSTPEQCMAVCGSEVGCSNIAFPELVLKIMPSGLRGLMMAVMMAALMSDLTSIFNSASTLFTIDVYGRFRSKASVRELMIVGRVMVAVMTGVGILWIPVIQNVQGGQLFVYIQAVTAYLSPPIASIYVLALFWKRTTEMGAFWGMMIGFVVGALRMILDFRYQSPRCGDADERPAITANVHYMYFAIVAFAISTVSIVIISLFTKPHPGANTARLTWWTRHDASASSDHPEEERDDEIAMEHVTLSRGKQASCDSMTGSRDLENASCPEGTSEGSKQSRLRRFVSWVCGYEQVVSLDTARRTAVEHQQRMRLITSLEQDPRAKIFLNANLVVISIACISIFIYFSV
ncbi:predicted protein [Nematostella vectensis]|uniref:Sodium/myo-inositol cotransporter n=1 Tax=Nematostella vectensis TaxID=45351 RepID=A7RY63_NEMVE|nr:predicted protein [Nematostella vectensis]|eukprot:XP_001635645.1 predicted protein [Nematostella vectensis]